MKHLLRISMVSVVMLSFSLLATGCTGLRAWVAEREALNDWPWQIEEPAPLPKPAPDPVPVPDPAPDPDPVPVPEPQPDPGPAALQDDVPAGIRHVRDQDLTQDFWQWPITHELEVRWEGRHVDLRQTASRDWPVLENVNASVLWGTRKGDTIRWRTIEYTKRGQTMKGFPMYPEPDHPDWPWDIWPPGTEGWMCLAGMCRDRRNNIEARTQIVPVVVGKNLQ